MYVAGYEQVSPNKREYILLCTISIHVNLVQLVFLSFLLWNILNYVIEVKGAVDLM